ncbi:hypothetical protein SAMN05444920_102999 [Nonomuraea solani]|uniref:Uncharacterized protein n=1 Tax=Nonomuraea solani TaxID=1144553 RepID=A0A1H6A2G9_9ACTN|nr:hypothetical protein SAMN05444920_102999 [Nonomuraea solani]
MASGEWRVASGEWRVASGEAGGGGRFRLRLVSVTGTCGQRLSATLANGVPAAGLGRPFWTVPLGGVSGWWFATAVSGGVFGLRLWAALCDGVAGWWCSGRRSPMAGPGSVRAAVSDGGFGRRFRVVVRNGGFRMAPSDGGFGRWYSTAVSDGAFGWPVWVALRDRVAGRWFRMVLEGGARQRRARCRLGVAIRDGVAGGWFATALPDGASLVSVPPGGASPRRFRLLAPAVVRLTVLGGAFGRRFQAAFPGGGSTRRFSAEPLMAFSWSGVMGCSVRSVTRRR